MRDCHRHRRCGLGGCRRRLLLDLFEQIIDRLETVFGFVACVDIVVAVVVVDVF